MVLSSSRALAILPQLGQLLSNLRTFHHFTGRSVIFHRAKFNPENSNCTTGMSSIADYLAKVDAEGQAADKTTPATSTDQLMDSIECPTSSIPKSYFQVKPKGRWTKREKTTIEVSSRNVCEKDLKFRSSNWFHFDQSINQSINLSAKKVDQQSNQAIIRLLIVISNRNRTMNEGGVAEFSIFKFFLLPGFLFFS